MVFDKVSGKESLGGGDIKLLFMTGLYMRPWVTLFNLILSCILGLIFVVVLKKDKIPFGPSISLAAMISILIGSEIVNWYAGLLF
jgi:leader peptidase (prepilin peptidase)/N-methyltransferase